MAVSTNVCTTRPPRTAQHCGPNQPQINITARIKSAVGFKQGLVFMAWLG